MGIGLGALALITILGGVLGGGSPGVNFLVFLSYFIAAVYFSYLDQRLYMMLLPAMIAVSVLLFGLGAATFKPTVYFMVSLLLVGIASSFVTNKYIELAGIQAGMNQALQKELRASRKMRTQVPSGGGNELDAQLDHLRAKEMEVKKLRLLFSELFTQLRSMAVSLNERQIFNSLYFVLSRGLKVQSAEIFFLDDSGSYFFTADSVVFEGSKARRGGLDVRIPHDGGNIISICAGRGSVLLPETIEEDPALRQLSSRELPGGVRTRMCAPLSAENEIKGVLNISACGKDKLEDVEKKLFMATAAIAGAAFSNAKTFLLTNEELRRKEELTEKEKAERIRTRNLLDKIMDKKIVAEIMKNPNKNFNDRFKITVLLADVRGFTTMSEKMSPSEVVEFLNDYFSTLTPIIFKYNGTLDKYIGDEIMALFGPPEPKENTTQMAVMCALEMRKAFMRFKRKWRELKGMDVEMGIALNTGEAIVGFIGSENLTNYTAIGDTVNTTARLEDVTPAGAIYATEATYKEVASLVEAKPAGKSQFKGKTREIAYYEISGIRTAKKPAAVTSRKPAAARSGSTPTPPAAARRTSGKATKAPAAPHSGRPSARAADGARPRRDGSAAGAHGSAGESRAGGTKAAGSRYCSVCGNRLRPDEQTCGRCGTPV